MDDTVTSEIFQVVKQVSAQKLQQFSRLDEVQLLEAERDLLVLGRWSSVILISSRELRIIFRVHFKSSAAKALQASAMRRIDGSTDDANPEDFMKEYVNLVAGGVKAIFAAHDFRMGISLPMITDGFDELFYPPGNQETTFSDRWSLYAGEQSMRLSADLGILDINKLTSFRGKLSVLESKGGEIEFL